MQCKTAKLGKDTDECAKPGRALGCSTQPAPNMNMSRIAAIKRPADHATIALHVTKRNHR